MAPPQKQKYKMYYGRPVAIPGVVKTDPKKESEACSHLCNISPEEIQRRYLIGYVGWALTLAWGFSLVYFNAPRYFRISLIVPLILAGFTVSAKSGICGIAYKNVWDPDGAGIRKIENKEIAFAIRNKAFKVHGISVAVAVLVVVLFTLW